MEIEAEELRLRLPGGLSLAALAWGPEQGRRVLALHGWLDNAASFAPLAPHLPDCRLIALELAGHGHSDHRPGFGHYHYADYLDDALAAADALGWECFTLLGHSLGAGLAPLLAVMAPERVEGLWLIDALGPLGRPADTAAEALRSAAEQLHGRNRYRPQSAATFDDLLARRIKGSRSPISTEAARILCERGAEQCDGRWHWRHDPRLLLDSPFYLDEAQIRAILAELATPTLLIQGDRGLLASRPRALERIALVKGLGYRILPGGHHIHMESPQAIADFINGKNP